VGALWGCTNPLINQGSKIASNDVADPPGEKRIIFVLTWSLQKFFNVMVWLPYLLNQTGSIIFYFTLAHSDLSLAVPVCNGLALIFSIGTSLAIGERINSPIKTVMGAALVFVGVTICLSSRRDDTER